MGRPRGLKKVVEVVKEAVSGVTGNCPECDHAWQDHRGRRCRGKDSRGFPCLCTKRRPREK